MVSLAADYCAGTAIYTSGKGAGSFFDFVYPMGGIQIDFRGFGIEGKLLSELRGQGFIR